VSITGVSIIFSVCLNRSKGSINIRVDCFRWRGKRHSGGGSGGGSGGRRFGIASIALIVCSGGSGGV
jgi:hypothetical protein